MLHVQTFENQDVHDFLEKSSLRIHHSRNYFPLLSILFHHVAEHDNNTIQRRFYVLRILSDDGQSGQSREPLYNPLSRHYHGIILDSKTHTTMIRSFFIKTINLLDNVSLVKGFYGDPRDTLMTSFRSTHLKLCHKIYFQFNHAYVETLAMFLISRLTEERQCPHFPILFGAYSGISEKTYSEFTEEYYQYSSSCEVGLQKGWFSFVSSGSSTSHDAATGPSISCEIDEDLVNMGIEELGDIRPRSNGIRDSCKRYTNDSFSFGDQSYPSDELIYLEAYHCPTQTLIMEKFDKTYESVLKKDISDVIDEYDKYRMSHYQNGIYHEYTFFYQLLYRMRYRHFQKKHLSILMQIMMALISMQHHYKMCHNDLHIENVMLQRTSRTHLIYCVRDKIYQVPTYGYIVKIIDYGRCTFMYDKQYYIGDIFKMNSDAGEQYSYPYSHWKSKKYIPMNFSFDLCRFACSVLMDANYEQIPMKVTKVPHEPINKQYMKSEDEFYNILHVWTTDRYSKSFLIKPNGFDLYKLIARRAVHSVPLYQLRHSCFHPFQVSSSTIVDHKYYRII